MCVHDGADGLIRELYRHSQDPDVTITRFKDPIVVDVVKYAAAQKVVVGHRGLALAVGNRHITAAGLEAHKIDEEVLVWFHLLVAIDRNADRLG